MSKFYEVSKVLDKRTDTHGRVQFLFRWCGYGKKFNSWVNEQDTNECLKQVFRTRQQGTPGLLQTLAVLVAEKLNMKKPWTTSIMRRPSVTMPMDAETFRELSSGLPSSPNLLRATKFSAPMHELDTIQARIQDFEMGGEFSSPQSEKSEKSKYIISIFEGKKKERRGLRKREDPHLP